MVENSFQNLKYDAQPARKSVPFILVSITTLAIGLLFFISLTYFKSIDLEAAETRLSLYERSLNDTLERFQYFPFVLAQDPLVRDGLTGVSTGPLNSRLAQFAEKSGLEAIYLMDSWGRVLAASNHDKDHSFVGQNYGFRPYFKQAMDGQRANYFGVGATTGRPGFFVSEPVQNDTGSVVGVITIKLDASELQHAWENGGENVLVSNTDGIVVLSSNRDWLYGVLNEISPETLSAIKASKQFGTQSLQKLNWAQNGPSSVKFSSSSYTYAAAEADHHGWKIHYLLGEGRAYERALLTTVVFGSGISLLVGFATYLRSRRIKIALANSQFDRDQLFKANQKLELAHSELARSSKLAALGQLSASVVHELGQPISALRNYLTAEEISDNGRVHPNQAKLNGVVDRMESITKQLRFFTKPGDQKMEPVLLTDVVSGSYELMRHEFETARIKVDCDMESRVSVVGNKLRLEQVVVNLLKNAIQSLSETSNDCLAIKLSRSNNTAVVSIEDNGTGFGERELSQLQEPFHTTRSSGDGMGLGLSISAAIIKEHGGSLFAENRPEGGAIFSINLPIASDNESDTK